ncbi:MAG: hypothetical protein A2498_14855 [Lentisphaerae bacterium RIFOXYC12_FULL_60_16]|nr:MAG: hypothetical protein A2498_14855 [Lentisphaerae bacterium RIFOXYC12_FULL_60_16]
MDTAREEKYKATLKAARDTIRSLTETADSLRQRLAAPGTPIAVVGMAGEFPGPGSNADAFRRMLLDGVDAAGAIPAARWEHDRYYAAKPGTPGKYYCTKASFLARDPFAFDHEFFSLTRAEAEMMDPQQRLLLTQSHHALEDAGIPPSSLQQTDAGVFLGISSFDHLMSFATPDLQTRADPYTLTGASFNSACGRLSYWYDIHGPCMTFDTACSSSLVAVLTAVESLRKGDCPLAFAGGVNLLLSPLSFVALSAIHALSADGWCRAFGEGATGFGRGEGCGIVILKRLDDALEAGDRIHAVILGGAIGHDGQSAGFTAPSGVAQQRVIERAMRDARITPGEVGYVETHGTGTDLGDPMEASSLADTFGKRTPNLLIGSVKSNIGHLEAAAGMAALFKAVFAVRDGEIPPSLHAETPSSKIDWQALPITVCRECTPWADSYPRRIAGVSSFGISGTLAHLLVAAPPERTTRTGAGTQPPAPSDWRVLPLSARNDESLARLTASVTSRLNEPGQPLADLCDKATSGRDHFPRRIALCACDAPEAGTAFAAHAGGKRSREVITGTAGKRPRIAFLFSGQGSQSPGMGQTLYQTNPVFRETINACDRIAARPLGVSLCEIMFAGADERLNSTRFTQPVIYAMGAALTDLWRSLGIRPTVVLGHSIGEYAAAYTAQVVTLEQGMEIVLERARLADSITTPGRMAAVLTDEETARGYLEGTDADLAAVNGNNVTLTGPAETVAALCAKMWAAGIAFRDMPVSQAFHSRLIEPVLGDFDRFLRGQTFGTPAIRFVSAMTAAELTGQTNWPSYWTEQMRQTVRFRKALDAIGPVDIYLEIGASPTLTSLCRTKTDSGRWLFSQGPGVPAGKQVALTLARLYTEGCTLNGSGMGGRRSADANLPLYPFHETVLRPPQPDLPATTPPVPAFTGTAGDTPTSAIMDLQARALNRLFEWQRQTLDRLQREHQEPPSGS